MDKKLTFFLFCLANITISLNFTALAAAVPVMSQDLSQSQNLVSQTSAYYMIPYGLGALLYTPLASHLNFRVILASAMAVYGVLNFLCAGSDSIFLILAARVLMGLAAACVIPLCLIAVGTLFEKGTRGRFVGLFFSTSFIASIAGIALSGIGHWRLLFVVPGLLGILTALLVLIWGRGMSSLTHNRQIDYIKVLENRGVQNFFIFIFILSFLYHGIHKWLAVYLSNVYALDQFAISALFMLAAICGAFGQNLGGWITDKIGRNSAAYFGVLILALSSMCLVGKYPLALLAIILAALSIGWAVGHNGFSTVLTDFPDEKRSEIAALNSAIRFFSGGLGFFMGGPFVERNISATYFVFGVCLLFLTFFVKQVTNQSARVGVSTG